MRRHRRRVSSTVFVHINPFTRFRAKKITEQQQTQQLKQNDLNKTVAHLVDAVSERTVLS